MKPENQYWQYIFLHEKQMAIIEAAPFAVDLLISPLRSVSWKTKRASIRAFGETYRQRF
jgi:hypothetical protein